MVANILSNSTSEHGRCTSKSYEKDGESHLESKSELSGTEFDRTKVFVFM